MKLSNEGAQLMLEVTKKETKRLQKLLRESRKKYRSLFELIKKNKKAEASPKT